MNKKILCGFLALVVAVILVFQIAEKPRKQYKIMFIPKSDISSFWRITIEGFYTASAEYNVIGEMRNPQNEEDVVGQAKLVHDAIDENFDAIVISANSYEGLAPAVQDAIDAGLEVVNIDSDVNVDDIRVRISTDNYNAGFHMGEEMARMLDYTGNIGVLAFDTETQNGEARVQGFLDAIAQYHSLKIVQTEETASLQDAAAGWTEKIILENPDLDGIATFNEIITVGMGQAIEKLHKEELVCMGFDNSDLVLDYLERDILDATIIQNQFAMGYLGAQYAIELLNGADYQDTTIDTGTYVVTRDNMFEMQTIVFPFYADDTHLEG